MEILIFPLIAFAIYAMIAAPIKRSKITHTCPRCGSICHASPWSSGLRYRDTGAYIHNFKCQKCGNKFTD